MLPKAGGVLDGFGGSKRGKHRGEARVILARLVSFHYDVKNSTWSIEGLVSRFIDAT